MLTLMVAFCSGPGQFTITSVTIEAGCALINVTFVQVSHVTCDDYELLLSINTVVSGFFSPNHTLHTAVTPVITWPVHRIRGVHVTPPQILGFMKFRAQLF